jgi:hypothetical protein
MPTGPWGNSWSGRATPPRTSRPVLATAGALGGFACATGVSILRGRAARIEPAPAARRRRVQLRRKVTEVAASPHPSATVTNGGGIKAKGKLYGQADQEAWELHPPEGRNYEYGSSARNGRVCRRRGGPTGGSGRDQTPLRHSRKTTEGFAITAKERAGPICKRIHGSSPMLCGIPRTSFALIGERTARRSIGLMTGVSRENAIIS